MSENYFRVRKIFGRKIRKNSIKIIFDEMNKFLMKFYVKSRNNIIFNFRTQTLVVSRKYARNSNLNLN